MTALIFLVLAISPFLTSSTSLYGTGNVGNCINNQVELPDEEEIHFVAIGDWGSGHTDQEEVAFAIGEFCHLNRCDFVISTGDNFYHDGVESPVDENFDIRWKDMYSHPSIAQLNWYLTVGNHDHHYDHEWYQVEYSAFEPRWRMPCLTHSFNVSTKGTSAMFVLVDTVSIDDDKNEAAAMKDLFESELVAAGENDWKIAIGHFPCHSAGHYSGISSTRYEIEPILNEQNVDFSLSGHDHNLQHWTKRGNPSAPDHIVTGAGGQNAYGKSDSHVAENEAMGMNLDYFTNHYGFTFFSVSKTEITVSFVGADGRVVYQYTRNNKVHTLPTLPSDTTTRPDVMDGPKWQMYDGLIGDKPGVGIRPRQSDAFIHSQMIRLQSWDQNQIPSHPEGEGSTNADYAARVHTFFERYMKSPAPPDPVVDHYLDDPYRFKGYKAFDPKTTLGPCGSYPYGYVGEHVKPCIYIKLNKIWGWQPSPVQCDEYNRGSYDYDYECPPSLRRHLNSAAAMEAGEENIWINCHGRNAADKEALDGRITYYPASRAIPISYFPYLGERGADFPVGTSTADVGFHPPLVAIQVDPSPLRGQLVHIECRAYYSGVRHNSKDKLGLVQFEVQID